MSLEHPAGNLVESYMHFVRGINHLKGPNYKIFWYRVSTLYMYSHMYNVYSIFLDRMLFYLIIGDISGHV